MYENWKVYVHVNKVNGKKYFGITSRSLEKRFGSNRRNYTQKNKGTKTYFELAINKYGWNGFEHILLFENLNKFEACSLEKIFISFYKSNDRKHGYNMTGGGEGSLGLHPSDETRRKISISGMRENLSAETRRKLSESHKRENLSPEVIEKYRIASLNRTTGFIKGSKHTDLAKRKMSESNKNKKELLCLNSFEIFKQAGIPADILSINRHAIGNCARGQTRSSGIHPITKEKIRWMYLDDFNLLSKEEKINLKNQFYTGSFLMPEKERDIYE